MKSKIFTLLFAALFFSGCSCLNISKKCDQQGQELEACRKNNERLARELAQSQVSLREKDNRINQLKEKLNTFGVFQ